MECPSCKVVFDEPLFILTPELKHYAKNECPHCGRNLGWVKKPENVGKRTRTSKYTIESLGKDCCELCRRTKPMLGRNQTLEIHHKDCNAENDVPENLLVLCTPCHKQTHFNKTYFFDHYIADTDSPARAAFFSIVENM
jgi:5-methylcytosine-specific restriction endonuclease McrA